MLTCIEKTELLLCIFNSMLLFLENGCSRKSGLSNWTLLPAKFQLHLIMCIVLCTCRQSGCKELFGAKAINKEMNILLCITRHYQVLGVMCDDTHLQMKSDIADKRTGRPLRSNL